MVRQLRFARSELMRCLEGLSARRCRAAGAADELHQLDGRSPGQPGTALLLDFPGREILAPGLVDLVGTGRPASTPPLDEMLAVWQGVTHAADAYLDTLDARRIC